jgi:hypothetical protein
MRKHVLVVTTLALIATCGSFGAAAQSPMTPGPEQQHAQHHPTGQEGAGAMGGMMGHRMMGGGMMGRGTMGPPVMMRMMFALIDADGDGTISLPEFQAAHERIFRAMDSNKDGRLTPEEMQAFMQGARRPQ